MGVREAINSYIIYKNPELKEIAEEKGVHGLVNWAGPIMTDSGTFQSHVYGEIEMKPEEILEFQKKIGVDIGTVLDVFCEPETRFEQAKDELTETQKRIELADKNKGNIFQIWNWSKITRWNRFFDTIN